MKPFSEKWMKMNQQIPFLYLCAVSFHNKGPSSTSASKVSHKEINWNVLWPKHQLVHLALGSPFNDGKKYTRKQKITSFIWSTLASLIVFIWFWLMIHFGTVGQHNTFSHALQYRVRTICMHRELIFALPTSYTCLFLKMVKALTFVFEIFRCKM